MYGEEGATMLAGTLVVRFLSEGARVVGHSMASRPMVAPQIEPPEARLYLDVERGDSML